MKIIIALVGNLRHHNTIKYLEENITFLKKQFYNFDYKIIIFTWEGYNLNLKNVMIKEYRKLNDKEIIKNISNFKLSSIGRRNRRNRRKRFNEIM